MDDLGDLYSIHRPEREMGTLYLVFGIGLIGLSVVLILIAIDSNINLETKNTMNYLYFLAIISLIAGIYLYKKARYYRTTEVRIYNYGVVYKTGNKEVSFFGNEIINIFVSGKKVVDQYGTIVISPFYFYLVTLWDGRQFEFGPPLEDTEGLGDRLNDWLIQYQLPIISERLNRGETITFMEFGINHFQISFQKKVLPITNLGKIVVFNGEILILKKSGEIWAKTFFDHLPNTILFLTILGNLSGNAVSSDYIAYFDAQKKISSKKLS